MNLTIGFLLILPKFMRWFELLLCLVRLGVSLWAYRHSRKSLVICLSGLLPIRGMRSGRRGGHQPVRLVGGGSAGCAFSRKAEAVHRASQSSVRKVFSLRSCKRINIRSSVGMLISGICVFGAARVTKNCRPISAANAAQRGMADLGDEASAPNAWQLDVPAQLTRQVSEHLVRQAPGRMGYVAAPFAGNVPLFDLLAPTCAVSRFHSGQGNQWWLVAVSGR